jgi:hypothetical protein
VVPVVPILFFYLIFNKKFNLIKKFIISLFFTGILLIPYVIFIIKLDILSLVIEHSTVKFSTSPYASLNIQRHPPVLSIASWTYYLKTLVNQLSVPLFILSIISLFWVYLKKERNWKLILTWIFIIYIMLSLFQNKEPRYSITYIPAFVLSVSYMLERILTRKKWKNLMVGLVLLTQLLITFLLLPRSIYPLDEISNILYEKTKGNIAFVSEGRVYSSAFMFKVAKLDDKRGIAFYRSCVFFNKTEDEIQNVLKENNIHYLILVRDGIGKENFEKIKNLELEQKFDNIELYKYREFEEKGGETCNFICLTNEKICLKELEV